MKELIRRIALLFFVSLAVGIARYAELGEYYLVHKIPVSLLRTPMWGAWGMSGAEKQRLQTLPLEDLVKDREHAPLLLIDRGPLRKFYDIAMGSFSGSEIPGTWAGGAEYSVGDLIALWLHTEQLPQQGLGPAYFRDDQDQVVLAKTLSDKTLLRIRRIDIKQGDYSPFNGFSGNTPPYKMLYPYTYIAFVIAIAGLLCYLLIPWTKPPSAALSTPRWQVVFMDMISLLLFTPFFILGWAFMGPSSLGPFSGGWYIGIIMWLLSTAGLYLFEQGVFYALFAVRAEDEGLWLRTVQGTMNIRYSQIKEVRGVILKNPRWLTILLALTAWFGKGSQSYLAAGQALMSSNTSYPGMALLLHEGGIIYLWGTPAGNTDAHIKRFRRGLDRAGVISTEKPLEIRGFATEPKFAQVADVRCNALLCHPVRSMLLTPCIAIILAYGFALF